MKDAYPYFIFLSIIGLLMSILLAYIYKKEKNKNPYFLIAAFLLFLLPFLMTLGMVLNSEKFISAAFLFPIALFMIATSIELLIRYKNCTCVVSAKCVLSQEEAKAIIISLNFHIIMAVSTFQFVVLCHTAKENLKRILQSIMCTTYMLILETQNNV